MKHLYDETRHNAHETLKEVNKHLSNPKVTRHPKNMAMLMRMKHDAVNTLDKLDRIQRNDYRGDINRDMADAYNMIDRILPHLEEMENRRGVKGTGRYSRRRMEAYNYNRGTNNDYNYNNDNTDYDNDTDYGDMDDDEEAENARRGGWRPRRTRRGVGRFTQVRTHVRRKPGADMDDDYMAEAMARTAAEAAAETAKQMTNTNIYPHTPPVMPQQENRAADMFNANTNDKRAIGVNR